MKRQARGAGELEAAVMDAVWSADQPVTVREVMESISVTSPRNQPAYTTVMTVLDRLHRKGSVEREERGRAYHYVAATTKAAHVAALMEQVLDGSSDRVLALKHFAAALPAEEVSVLRKALMGARRPSSQRPG